MADQQDPSPSPLLDDAQFEQASAAINRSIGRCRMLLADCRTVLAANSNEPLAGRDHDRPTSG